MQRVVKPKNARSKRALIAREPKQEENVKKAIFARSSTSSASVNAALAQLLLLKKPDGIPFSKANLNLHPFEDATALEFWSQKNDAAFIVMGSHSKKRPNNLTLARMFDHQVLDMLEVGVDMVQTIADVKAATSPTLGLKPLFHFSGDLFDSHPSFILFKSLILDLYQGRHEDQIDLQGLQYLISISHGPSPPSTSLLSSSDPLKRPIHLRTYTTKFLKSGTRTPYLDLTPCGPSLDLSLRRSSEPASERWKQATTLKRRVSLTADLAKSKKKARKNVDVDTMGDKIGMLHVGRQDLGKLQSRKMKGLKPARKLAAGAEGSTEVALTNGHTSD